MKTRLFFVISLFFSVLSFNTYGQLKQVYKDADEDNEVRKISLYSKSEGYVTFKNWIGYTTDGGASYEKKTIGLSNVNFNGFQANLTFGFALTGTIAFDKNNLIVYGDYGLVPSILTSNDGGATFKLVYNAQSSDTKFSYMVDMVFPDNSSTGYAIDQDRVLKTIDKGKTWVTVYTAIDSYLKSIQSSGSSFLAVTGRNKILRSSNLGVSWNQISLPSSLANNNIQSSNFISTTKGWVNFAGSIFSTSDGGNSWTIRNNSQYDPMNFSKMGFLDDNVGFALGTAYNVYKTANGGKNWEVLPRETNFTYLGYQHYTMQLWNSNEFLVGGGYGLLEATTNGGGTPIPKAIFSVDKSLLTTTAVINLINYSKADYTYKWYKNDLLFANTYNASYQRNSSVKDIIRLEVSNGAHTESTTQEISLSPLPIISSFSPQSAGVGEKILLLGTNFSLVSKVTVGGVNSSFVINSENQLIITVSNGASGDILLFTADGFASISGFTFIPPPIINSFSPLSAPPGSEIIITGINFENVKEVRFGGTLVSNFRVNSSSSITATVGAGTSGMISLIASGGKAELAGFILQPVISSFFPKTGTINEVLTINGGGFEGVTNVSVGGTTVKSFQIKSPTLITAVIGASANGDVMVSKTGGASSLGSFTFYFAPIITSFSPELASVGTEVKINGSNFSPIPTENIVYFGGVRAVVTASTATQLTAIAPVGAGYGFISVCYHQLTAYSTKPFSPLLSGNNVISNTSFKESDTPFRSYLNNGINAIGDFDGDGKLDCAVATQSTSNQSGFIILKNISTTGAISFQESGLFISGQFYYWMACADMDGDGKLDVIAGNSDSREIHVFRNISDVNGINFDAAVKISNITVSGILICDLDNDGKPDVVSGNTVIKNSSSLGAISFFDKIELSVDGNCSRVADFDNDGKVDLCFVSFATSKFTILRNISSIGSIAFESKKEYIETNVNSLNFGDFDNDGKLDLVMLKTWSNVFVIYKNSSNIGQINFNRYDSEYSVPPVPQSLGVADFDGDGKLDIIVNSNQKSISIFKNIYNAGVISFSDRVDQELTAGIIQLGIADFDGDGRCDVIGGVIGETKFKTLRNLIVPSPYISSFSPSIGVEGTEIIIKGYNFTGATQVRFGEVDAQSFVVRSPTEIAAKVATGSSGKIDVTNLFGTGIKLGFSFGVAPTITTFTPQNGPAGTAVTITGSNFDPVAGKNIVFFGDVPAKVISASASNLVVEAPKGSKQTNITVTTASLTAYSTMPYINTYAGATPVFDKNSYAEKEKFTQFAGLTTMVDVDGDGVLDVLLVQGSNFSILRNTGFKGSVSFDPIKSYRHDFQSLKIAIADFDGDGKQDFLLNTYRNTNESTRLSIFRNLSIPGQISLDAKIELNIGGSFFFTSDIDLDGRPDIVVLGDSYVAILRNISKLGAIKFENPVNISVPGIGTSFASADFDNDGRTDLAIITSYPNLIIQLRNTSLPGNISFTKLAEIAISSFFYELRAADLDGDGKIDLVARNRNPHEFNIFKNTDGVLATTPTLSLSTVERFNDFTIADLDGDGKMDILGEGVSVFKNSSTSSTISFQPEAGYQNTDATSSTIGDLDGDDRPDILLSGYPIRIFVNQIGKSIPEITSFTPNKATLDQAITISGKNFTGATSVQIGDFPAKSFVINSSSSITATVGVGGSGKIKVTTLDGIGYIEGFEYIPQPVIYVLDPIVSSENYTFSIRGGDFTGTTSVKFGGVAASSFKIINANEITGIIGKGASGEVEVKTPIGTAKKAGYIYVPKIMIIPSGSTTVPVGGSVTLSINVESNFTYKWYRNGFLISSATGSSIQATESGSYTVITGYQNFSIVSDPVIVTAIGNLPSNNLKVKVVNESCKKNDDGLIEVTAVQALKYTAKLYLGNSLVKTIAFTQSVNFTNLAAGSYTVCITHEDDTNYNKCFNVIITEPKDIILSSYSIGPDQNVTLIMEGADLYFISLNGNTYQSTTGKITLALSDGGNNLKISGVKPCQGIVEKNLIFEKNFKVYPNPFDSEINVELPLDFKANTVNIELFNSSGKKVFQKTMVCSAGYVQLNLAYLPPGIYLLSAMDGRNILRTKIIKK